MKAWILLVLGPILLGCHGSEPADVRATGAHTTGVLPGTGVTDPPAFPLAGTHSNTSSPRQELADDLLILTMGSQRVTLGEIRRTFLASQLMRGRPLEEVARLTLPDDPYELMRWGEQVLARRRLLREGETLGLLPGREEILEIWRGNPSLGPMASRSSMEWPEELARQLGLEVEDLFDLVSAAQVYPRWLDRVTADIPPEDLRSHYFYLHRTVTIDVVEILNLPTSEEIEAFLARLPQPDWAERTYQDHIGLYTEPESADVRIVRIRLAPDASPEQVASAQDAIDQLRAEVETGADMVRLSREVSEDPARQRGGLMTGVVRPQFPAAFEIAPQGLSPVQRDEHGLYFFRVENRYPARPRPLDHLLEREMAAATLGSRVILPGPAALAEQVLSGLRAGQDPNRWSGERTILVRRLEEVRREPDGMIPSIGVSQELQAAIFALTPQEPVVDRPFLVNSSLFVVRLVTRNDQEESDFQADRARFEEEYRRMRRAVAWDDFWGRCREEEPIEVHWVPPERGEKAGRSSGPP
ncbi:MAG: peptidyl-prolyl cis-trans isomerase [Bradymonadales bacterium]|nr:peptidyl-prolyl cis-trans isomerase [Bradymonadales bacterium]